MNNLEVILIIVLVLGIIVSNLMVLKYSAKMKWPSKQDLTDPVARLKRQHPTTDQNDQTPSDKR